MKSVVLFLCGLCLAACAATDPDSASRENGAPGPKLEIKIKGNDGISDRDLKRAAVDEIALLNRFPEEYRADDAAFTMEELYRERGYPFVRVGYEFETGPPIVVTFRVGEGPRTVIGEVSLIGRGEASRRDLMRFFKGPTDSWMDIGGNTLFNQTRVDQAANLIESWYRSEGYLEVEVNDPRVTFYEDNRKADIQVHIRPGLRFAIRKLRFDGVPPDFKERFIDEVDLEDDQAYTRSWERNAENACVRLLRMEGHVTPEVEAEATIDHETGIVDLHFRIEAGPKCRIGQIRFQGLDRTAESILEPHIKLSPGDFFDGERLRNTLVSLYEVGIFSKIRVEEKPGPIDQVDICFHVEERQSKDLAFMAGYGSYELVRGGISYTDRNVFGRGLSWNSQLKASIKSARIETGVSDPSFLRLPVVGSVKSFGQYRRFPSFTERRTGTVFSLSKHWEGLKGSTGYSYEKSWTDDVEEGAEPFESSERVNLGTIFTRWVLDDRNHILSPDRGSKHELGIEVSNKKLAGEISFNRFTGSTAWMFPFDASAEWVLAMRAEAGVLVRSGDTTFIPLQFRYFNGGADSVRSFKEDELSPRRSGDYVGGEYYSTASVELRTPLVKHLRGVVFADAGNVIERRQDIRFRYYRYALGVGLRYALPIGPVRLDWGWNPNRQSHEDLWALHFSIGFPF